MAAPLTVGARIGLIALACVACGRRSVLGDAGAGGIAPEAGDDAGGAADVQFPTADANCGQKVFEARYLAPELLVVLDRSTSVDPPAWKTFLSSMASTISAGGAANDWGLYAFPKDGPACGPGTSSPAIDVPPAQDSAPAVVTRIATASTGASGAPTAAAIANAAAYMLSRPNQNAKFLMLVTDGAPSCAGTTDPLSANPAQAQADAVAAIAAAYAAGVPTIVVAPSTTAAGDVEALNALAVAGRYQRAPPGPQFTTELTLGELLTPLELGSCTFSLGQPPPVPDVITVMLDGATVPRDRSRTLGWDYTDLTTTSIALYGAWCAQVLARRSWNLTVYLGCSGG